MNRCPITYEVCGENKYSAKALKLLSRNLKRLKDFPFTPQEQIKLARENADKMSVQGVQPKISLILDVKEEIFKAVDIGGKYILKPPQTEYEDVSENEDLSMRLASIVGIEVPFHGLIYNIDQSLSYFIKRFDRVQRKKIFAEDFSQILGFTREGKYQSSVETLVKVVDKHCTFPQIEKLKLFNLIIFNFLIGNEDAHLKNFTLIKRSDKIVLSPAYDLLNTTILMKTKEEIALTLKGKKSKLSRNVLVDHLGLEIMGFSEKIINEVLSNFKKNKENWNNLIDISFLSENMKIKYKNLVELRYQQLEL